MNNDMESFVRLKYILPTTREEWSELRYTFPLEALDFTDDKYRENMSEYRKLEIDEQWKIYSNFLVEGLCMYEESLYDK